MNEKQRKPTPEAGMGATLLMYSDRHAYTILSVRVSGEDHRVTQVTARRDKATRVDSNGMSDCQEWAFAPDPSQPIEKFSLRKDGTWRKVGDRRGSRLSIGNRSEFYDYSF